MNFFPVCKTSLTHGDFAKLYSMKLPNLLITIYLLCLLSSCKKQETESTSYNVNITINQPTLNQTILNNTPLFIDIVLIRQENAIIHNVKIEILSSDNTVIETLMDRHYHQEGSIAYSDGAYIPKIKGVFKLRVTTTDEKHLQPNSKEVAFIVN